MRRHEQRTTLAIATERARPVGLVVSVPCSRLLSGIGSARGLRLLVAATRVKDRRLRLFREHEISLEAVLAAACLPLIHHAVEIGGEW